MHQYIIHQYIVIYFHILRYEYKTTRGHTGIRRDIRFESTVYVGNERLRDGKCLCLF